MPEWDDIREDLEAYVSENHGAMTELADHLGVQKQRVFEWINKGVVPNYNTGAEIRKWLEERK